MVLASMGLDMSERSAMLRGRNPIVGLAAALLLLGAAPAVAGSNLTGNDLLERCSASASDNPIQWGVCLEIGRAHV